MSNFDKILDAGKSFACSLYRNQPGALLPNPVSDILKLAWDGLCGDLDPSNLPPPPSIPFEGGQCRCVVYGVRIQFDNGAQDTVLVYGEIGGSQLVYTPVSNGRFDISVQVFCRGNWDNGFSPCLTSQQWVQVGFIPNSLDRGQIRILSVTRQDGQPDNCGTLPPSYPPAPPPPVGGYTSPPTSITYNDGTDFTIIFNLQPPIDGTGSPPDICLTVDIKGIEFEVCFPFDALPRIGNGSGADSKIDDLLDELRRFRDAYDFDFSPPDYADSDLVDSEDLPPADSGEGDAEGILGVLVNLTKYPSDTQFGVPTIYFAGWFTFKMQGGYEERQPIHFEKSYFAAPPGSTGYAYTFTKGAQGSIVVYKEKPE